MKFLAYLPGPILVILWCLAILVLSGCSAAPALDALIDSQTPNAHE